jgi:uncharacterized membrane protein YqjE
MATDVRQDPAHPSATHQNQGATHQNQSATHQGGTQQSVTGLVSGIVNDTQELIKQHLELFRTEVKEDFTKTKEAVVPLTIGVVVIGVAAVLLCFTLVYLLHWAAAPHLELWHAFAIVTGVFLLAGGALVYAGKKKFDSFNPLPDKTLKEIQWTIKPK